MAEVVENRLAAAVVAVVAGIDSVAVVAAAAAAVDIGSVAAAASSIVDVAGCIVVVPWWVVGLSLELR